MLVLALGAAGHAPAEPPPSPRPRGEARRHTISVWTHAAEHTTECKVLKEAAQSFNRDHPELKVEIFASHYKNYEERIQNAAATGTLPCLMELDGPFLYAFAWPGYLRPIDPFVPRELLDDLLPSIVAQSVYHGRLYTLGQFDSGLAIWGNRRHLRAAGVRTPTLDAPWSLAEFEDALEKLTALEEVDYAITFNVYIGPGIEFYSYAYAPLVQGFGGDVIDRATYRSAAGVIDGPGVVAAMKRFQSWFTKGWTRVVFDRPDDFERGRVALSWIGHWKYAVHRRALGDDLVLLPMPDFGHGIKTGMGSWSWGISSTCRDPAATWEFLAHLMSVEEILRMTNANGAVPARYSAIARSPLYGAGGPLKVFSDQLRAGAGVPRPATPAYPAIRRAFSDAVAAIIAGGDVQTELTNAARRIDEDIARHHGYPMR